MLRPLFLTLAVMLGAAGTFAPAAFSAGRPAMVLQLGHTSLVMSVAVTLDGRHAITGPGDLLLWDLGTGAELGSLSAESGEDTTSFALSRDGRTLSCGDDSGRVKLVDLEQGRLIRSFKVHQGGVRALAFTVDGKYVASIDTEGELRCWNAVTGESAFAFKDRYDLLSLAVSPDGRWLAAGGITRTVRVWSLPDGREVKVLDGHGSAVQSLAFSPDSSRLASGSQDKSVRIWDLATSTCSRTLSGFSSGVEAVAFSPDGRSLAVAGASYTEAVYAIRLLDTASWQESSRFKGGGADVKCLAFTPDGSRLLTGHGNQVRVWDVVRGKELLPLRGRASAVRALAFSPDGKSLALGQNDSTARVWDLARGAESLVLKGHGSAVSGIAYSPDGKRLATASYDQTARLWDARSGRELKTLKGHERVVNSIAFSPNGGSLLTASFDATWRRWNAAWGSSRAFRGHEGLVYRAVLSRDGRRAATAGDDKTARIWDADSGAELRRLAHPGPVLDLAFLADGGLLLTGCEDKNARLWNVATGQLVETFPQDSPVAAVAASPDGARIALGHWNGTICLLEAGSGRQLAAGAQVGGVKALAFSPDGARLASAGWDGAAHLWDSGSGRELARLISLDHGWVVVTPEGCFDGSPEGLGAIHWTVGMQSFPLESFSEGWYVPALLPRILAGEQIGTARQPAVSEGFSLPPLVRITSPRDGAAAAAAEAEIAVEAVDQGGGVDEIRLYQNGKALSGEARGVQVKAGKARTLTFHALLVEGENRFRAVALSTARIESNPAEATVLFKGSEARPALHVLAVGIDHYRNSAMDLNFARADAAGLADFFTSLPPRLFRQVEAVRLFDQDATKAAILARLGALRSLPPQDVAVIYLAGHGETIGNTWYFLPFELAYPEREAEVTAKGLSSQELQDAIRNVGAQKVLVLLDACKSGEALAAFAGRGVEDRKALAMLARATGVHVMAASTKDQQASEVKDLGHGVFTYTILQGLSGKAAGSPGPGAVTVRKLLAYVEDQLPEISQKYRAQAQFPVVDSRGMDFPIADAR